jgi:predicted PurR-regulated permease PerM
VPGDRDSAGDHYQRPAGAGGATLYKNVENGKLDVAGYIEQFKNFLPPYFQHLLDRFGMGNLEGLREKSSRVPCRAVSSSPRRRSASARARLIFGELFHHAVPAVLLVARWPELVRKVRTAVPLAEPQKRRLQLKFNRVVRATVKGNVLVAVTQGALGGLIFWFLDIPSALLWAVLMAFLSLLPAVGAGSSGRRWRPISCSAGRSGRAWCWGCSGYL